MNTHIQPTSTLVERSGVGTRFTILHINEKDSFVMVWFDGLDGLKDLRDQITEYLDTQPLGKPEGLENTNEEPNS